MVTESLFLTQLLEKNKQQAKCRAATDIAATILNNNPLGKTRLDHN